MKKEHPNPQGQADKKMDWKKAEEMYSYEERKSLVRKKKRRYHFYMGEICSAVENTLWRDFHAGLLIVKWVIDIRSSLSPLAEKRRVSDRQFRLGRALPLVGLNSKLGAG